MQQQIVGPLMNMARTEYRVRIKTTKTLSDPYTRVNLCFVDLKGHFFITTLASTPSLFVRGNADLFSFDAPNLENTSHVLASQESGMWGLDEVELIDRDQAITRFRWNENVGNGQAAYMKPYKNPFDGMTKEDIREMFNTEYKHMKNQIRNSMAQMAIVGTASTAIALGSEKAIAFMVGSGIAYTYAYMLEKEIDAIGTSRGNISVVARMIALFCTSAAIIKTFEHQIHQDNSLFILGLMGFMVYKASIIRLIK